MTELLPVIERFGLPVAMIAVMGAFLWKAVWPFVLRRVEIGEQQVVEFTKTLQKQQELMEVSHGRLTQEVKLGFAHLDDSLQKISENLDGVLKR